MELFCFGRHLWAQCRDCDNELTESQPAAGRMVIVLSESFSHEVLAASKKRRSIAEWFLVGGI